MGDCGELRRDCSRNGWDFGFGDVACGDMVSFGNIVSFGDATAGEDVEDDKDGDSVSFGRSEGVISGET